MGVIGGQCSKPVGPVYRDSDVNHGDYDEYYHANAANFRISNRIVVPVKLIVKVCQC